MATEQLSTDKTRAKELIETADRAEVAKVVRDFLKDDTAEVEGT